MILNNIMSTLLFTQLDPFYSKPILLYAVVDAVRNRTYQGCVHIFLDFTINGRGYKPYE